MPRSKRDRQVPLTKTKKKVGREAKDKLLQRVRGFVEAYSRLFLISIENPRSNKLQVMRTELKDSKLLLGKNKLVARALGLSAQDEAYPNLHQVAKRLKYQKALLFTNRSAESVLEFLETFADSAFARSGFSAVNSVELAAGACPQWQHSMEPALRKLGLPVKLVKGVVHLERDHLVCRRRQRLSPEQCEVLKLCKYEMAEFSVRPLAVWDKDTAVVTDLADAKAPAGSEADGKVRLVSTVLDDGCSYFVPQLLPDDTPPLEEEEKEDDDDEDMQLGDEEEEEAGSDAG